MPVTSHLKSADPFNFTLRNLEAISDAGQAFSNALSPLAEQQVGMIRATMESTLQGIQEIAKSGTPQAGFGRAVDLTKQMMNQSMGISNLSAELIVRASAGALGVLQKRGEAALDEVKAMVDTAPAIFAPPKAD